MTHHLRLIMVAIVSALLLGCATQKLYVDDSANLLSREHATELDSILIAHNQTGFGRLRVIVLRRLPPDTTIEEYSSSLLNEELKAIGARRDRVILIVAIENRRVRIQTAPAVWSVLRDEFCQQVIDTEIVPSFKREEFFLGIRAGLAAIVAKLKGAHARQAV